MVTRSIRGISDAWVGDGEQKSNESKPGGINIVENGIVVTECPPCVRGI